MRSAGLEDFRFHDLRHTFASWAIQRGATLPELKDLLGHSSLAMVMRYAHLSPAFLSAEVSLLDPPLSPSPSTAPSPEKGNKRKGKKRAKRLPRWDAAFRSTGFCS